MVTLAAIGYASGRGLIGLSYGYGYQYCTTPSQYQYCSTSSTTSSSSTTTSSSSTTTTGSTTTTTGSTTTTTTTGTTTTTPKPGKGCGDKNHQHDRRFQCKITIHNAVMKEGNRGFTLFVFEVDLSDVPLAKVSVDYSTANGTAAAPSDYVSTSGTLFFPKGLPKKKGFITVKVKGDKTPEPNETFFVNLSNPSGNAVIDDPQGDGIIKNDD